MTWLPLDLHLVIAYLIFLTSDVTSNECIAGNGYILERNNTSEYIKELYKGSVSLQY